ncbi:ISL3 family transposase [Lactobacillus sp. ESL0791]|uniref:ISL3 family transposase n=1 Tax=Lactobacillus sp. ESL0791 TaxID=2983234 RepID=UPI0023F6A44F|nr:ISL3 family transposase [Lactobacillus sp. ESL0791]MDF7639013.1 ISL3 family transposase [Lactobacillus sp. ESL0791]
MSSLTNSIKFLLDIKDKNLIFFDFYLADDQVTKILVAELKLPLTQCPTCHGPLVHNGHYLSMVHYPAYNASHPLQIKLNKQRLYCRHCHQTFLASSSLVDKGCFIAKPGKQKILQELTTDRSMKEIAQANNVSDHTVLRVLTKFGKQPRADDYDYLPPHLGVDEFRGVGRQLHFIFIDGASHRIIRVLETRLRKDIIAYFNHFPLTVRNQVKTITMDLNSYYQDIAHELFPNALVVIDRFHIIQMLNRSFNQLLMQTMKQFAPGDQRYKLLKFYWKFYLKPVADLKCDKLKYYHHLKRMSNQAFIVDEGLDVSPKLRSTYELMQTFNKALRTHDEQEMMRLLNCKDDLGEQMKTTLKTFKRNQKAVINAAISKYANGCVEGTNRKIKQIERTAYGYRNFDNLVTRIMLETKNAVLKENTLSAVA